MTFLRSLSNIFWQPFKKLKLCLCCLHFADSRNRSSKKCVIPLKTLTFEHLAQTGCETAQCSYIFHICPIFQVLRALSKSFYDWDCWKNLEEETEGYLDIQYWADFNVKRFPNLPSSSLLTFRGILHQQESKHALLLHLADIYALQHISPMMIHHMSSYINIRQPISTYVNIYHHIICDIYSNTYQEESNFST